LGVSSTPTTNKFLGGALYLLLTVMLGESTNRCRNFELTLIWMSTDPSGTACETQTPCPKLLEEEKIERTSPAGLYKSGASSSS
jgi:hypothetical protein